MPFPATSPDTMLLKLIQVRSQDQDNLSVEELASELATLQAKPDICVYETDGDPAALFQLMRRDLLYLEEMGFVQCDFSNPHVRITEWGRFFADRLELPAGFLNNEKVS